MLAGVNGTGPISFDASVAVAMRATHAAAKRGRRNMLTTNFAQDRGDGGRAGLRLRDGGRVGMRGGRAANFCNGDGRRMHDEESRKGNVKEAGFRG